MIQAMNKIGILTSGGDAPGMNAAIRAITRTAIYHGLEVYGIKRGYQGLIEGDMVQLKTTDVSNIIQRGGTILKTARSEDFKTAAGRKKAFTQIKNQGVEGLILIGGDGTFRGATLFSNEHNIPVLGIPGTIDNDINGTDFTIGFDTALRTAVEAIDKIRDTAEAHDRIVLIEVMGRDAGHLALFSGISCGAEHIFIPELKEDMDQIIADITNDRARKKMTNIIVVAEGDEHGGATKLNQYLNKKIPGIDTRVTILGHVQRGGSPTPNDRILASRLGYHAVLELMAGRSQEMLGIKENQIHFTPFAQCSRNDLSIANDWRAMAGVLTK
jgi:6-phosphofructokinase 1